MSEQHTINLEGSDGNVLENQKAGLRGCTNKSKKRTRISPDECHITQQEKAYKRIISSVSRPSYLLQLGSDKMRPKNRVRLCHLLKKLMRQHNRVEASGVLSILLKGTCKDKGSRMNRFKYSVSMELLKHIECNDVELTSIDKLYDTWMTRIGINVSYKEKRDVSMQEDRIAVRLESILYQFLQGRIEGERQNARSLVRENDCNYYPLFNVIMGLIFYQLFYSSIPEDMQYQDSDHRSSTNSDMSAVSSQLDASTTQVGYEGGSGHNAHFNDSESSFQYDSEASVMNGKDMPAEVSDDVKKKVVSMEVDVNQQRDLPQGFYVNSAENEASADNNGGRSYSTRNLFAHKNLDSWLLPLRSGECELGREIHDDEYEHAVGYLRAAVCSTPLSLAALLPLIQLLLIRYRYKEALQELEKFSEISNAALSTRLRGRLLEHVDPNNDILLSTSYEDTLKRDPTCFMSLSKLISMHQNGNYGPESLLEMIALHLDAVFAEYTVWRDFALCFLKVSMQEQDCISMCSNGNEVGKKKDHSVGYNIPKLFIHGKTEKAWRFRCRWWLTRHFGKNQLASEMASGDLQLLTYKAACACHMYGAGFDYVVKVHTCLGKGKKKDLEKKRDLFKLLQYHMKNSAGFYFNCQERTN
ncbi:uncharacterized protein [Euphorbia lathyris]|uniref:uncharacterized protein isoform X2 n=1 Tax=Euphorbia lathyris TaxID=212925 RepID=UPI0033134EB5